MKNNPDRHLGICRVLDAGVKSAFSMHEEDGERLQAEMKKETVFLSSLVFSKVLG